MTTQPKHVKAGIISYLFIGLILLCAVCVFLSMANLGLHKIGVLATFTPEVPTATHFALSESNAIQTQAVATYQAANPRIKPTQTRTSYIPTKAPLPTAIPTDTPMSIPTADNNLGVVGKRIESAGIALTVVDAYKQETVSEYLKPDPGNVYMVVEVIVENVSRSEETPYNPFYFTIKDSSGYQYNPTIMAPGTPLKSGTLQTGDLARGTLAFEIKSTTRGFVLTYKPLVIFGGYDPIRILLGD